MPHWQKSFAGNVIKSGADRPRHKASPKNVSSTDVGMLVECAEKNPRPAERRGGGFLIYHQISAKYLMVRTI